MKVRGVLCREDKRLVFFEGAGLKDVGLDPESGLWVVAGLIPLSWSIVTWKKRYKTKYPMPGRCLECKIDVGRKPSKKSIREGEALESACKLLHEAETLVKGLIKPITQRRIQKTYFDLKDLLGDRQFGVSQRAWDSMR